ncbi:glutelin-2 [Hypomesus transpacificus]|uniref:glutelin-2 n=1 Tax=Hypomesus transpacificus TaxID=137520 RepID=UPI001F072531|nr:glutelin-2 [Hypomesus transpacificus]
MPHANTPHANTPHTGHASQRLPPTSTQIPQRHSNLTQAALAVHTQTTHNPFHSRHQQTQAALLHSAGQTKAPPPPPVLPLAQFQTLPRERVQKPDQGPHPLHPPVNMPPAQRQSHPHRLPGNIHRPHRPHPHPHAHTSQPHPRR